MNGEYGLLAGLVGSVAALLSAGAAITSAWVRTANWAPPEDGVPSAPTKVCALLTAVAVAGLWFETGKSLSSRDLEIIAGSAGGLTAARRTGAACSLARKHGQEARQEIKAA
jgi:hypothetical protein